LCKVFSMEKVCRRRYLQRDILPVLDKRYS